MINFSSLRHRLGALLQSTECSPRFLWVCAFFATLGTLTAAYPVTAVVVPAALIAPKRWSAITLVCALGSSLGAMGLVATIHLAGWETLSAHYPALVSHEDWIKITQWAADYGPLALFIVAATPLPQTPALIFFGMAQPDFLAIFLAIFLGKILNFLFNCFRNSLF